MGKTADQRLKDCPQSADNTSRFIKGERGTKVGGFVQGA